MNRIQRDTFLGVVFFGTIGFLLWATINLTDGAASSAAPLKVYVPDASGLRIGDPVQVLGKRIGKVAAIDADWSRTENRIALTLRIEEPIPLTLTQKVEIQSTGVLGGKQVYIDPGIGQEWPKDRELTGSSAKDVMRAASDFFGGDGVIGHELKELLIEARKFATSLNDSETTIGAMVKRRELYDEVLASAQSLRTIFNLIETGQGILGRAITDTNLRDDTLRIIHNFATVSDRLVSTDGTLGRLLNDRDMSTEFRSLVTDLSALTQGTRQGQGIVGKLLTDEALAKQFEDSLRSLNNMLHKADDPTAGTLGALLGDPAVRANFIAITSGIASITEKIDSGKGTLGVLINDEDMGIRLRRIFTQVSRALEDAREAAPVANFVQVLFGVF